MRIGSRPEKRPEPWPEQKPAHEPDNTRTPDTVESVNDNGTDYVASANDPERLTGGAWLSLGLSLSFYLIMLAIGAKYDSDHRVGSKPADSGRSVLAEPSANAPVSANGLSPVPPIDRSGALLARAHACAAVAQWDCVILATSGVIAQRGNTPETKALLAQAVVNGGWVRSRAAPLAPQSVPTSIAQTQDIRPVSATPQSVRRVTHHFHRRHERYPMLRYASTSHSDYPSYLPDIYRH